MEIDIDILLKHLDLVSCIGLVRGRYIMPFQAVFHSQLKCGSLSSKQVSNGLPEEQEARAEFREKMHRVWSVSKSCLDSPCSKAMQMSTERRQDLPEPKKDNLLQQCRSTARSLELTLEANGLPSCKAWSERVTLFTACASAQEAQLTFVQRDTLQVILSLLVSGISGCALLDVGGSNHGTETAESIAVRTPAEDCSTA